MNAPAPAQRSRKVTAYVRAYLRHQKLAARLNEKLAALEPLRVKVRDSSTQLQIRHRSLTGGQLAAAQRLIATLTLTEEGPS